MNGGRVGGLVALAGLVLACLGLARSEPKRSSARESCRFSVGADQALTYPE